ncbi:transposase [Pseudomonas fluorescens]|nr:transposase [Pseudomonas fluorescens]
MQLRQLVDELRDAVLGRKVIQADETPGYLLVPSSKRTHSSYACAYATNQLSNLRAVVYKSSSSRTSNGYAACLDGRST